MERWAIDVGPRVQRKHPALGSDHRVVCEMHLLGSGGSSDGYFACIVEDSISCACAGTANAVAHRTRTQGSHSNSPLIGDLGNEPFEYG